MFAIASWLAFESQAIWRGMSMPYVAGIAQGFAVQFVPAPDGRMSVSLLVVALVGTTIAIFALPVLCAGSFSTPVVSEIAYEPAASVGRFVSPKLPIPPATKSRPAAAAV